MAKQTNLFGGWAGEPNSKRCLEPGKFKESWKAVASWPHTAEMDLPTSLPTTRLKLLDQACYASYVKSTPRYHTV